MSSTTWNTHAVGQPELGERVDVGPGEAGHDPADAGRRREQRGGLALDREQVLALGAGRVVLGAQLGDLALDQAGDGGAEQPGHLGAEAGGDLGGAGQEEVARQDGSVVAPAGVDAGDGTAHLGLVHHVVVVERADVDELHRDAAADHVVAGLTAAGEGGADGHDGAQALTAGDDEMAGHLGQVVVGRAHGMA